MTSQENEPVWVWGLPLLPVTFEQALDRIDHQIHDGQPSFFITANLNYAMLVDSDDRLRRLNDQAAFVLADGMPLVWWSRLGHRRLPERVAGSDLIYGMCERAAKLGHRVYLLGAAPGVAAEAADSLVRRYPGRQIAGVDCPPFRMLSDDEERQQFERIHASKADILFVAFGQPKGELWIRDNLQRLGVPVCACSWSQSRLRCRPGETRSTLDAENGLEWVFRLAQEPRRLAGRYRDNILFLIKAVFAARFRKTQPEIFHIPKSEEETAGLSVNRRRMRAEWVVVEQNGTFEPEKDSEPPS